MMDNFSLGILRTTLDLLNTTPLRCRQNPRFEECVTVMGACMDLIALHPTNLDYAEKMLQALTEMAKIARENREFTIAAQLRTISGEFRYPYDRLGAREGRVAQSAR